MSHLINTPDSGRRQAFFSTCRLHLAPEGITIVERHDPQWLDIAAVGFLGSSGGVDAFLARIVRRQHWVEMTIRYESGKDAWTHSFAVERLDDNAIGIALEKAGLRFDRWLG